MRKTRIRDAGGRPEVRWAAQRRVLFASMARAPQRSDWSRACPSRGAAGMPATLPTTSRTYSSMPSRNGCRGASPRSMRFRRASHCPVIAGLFTSGCTTSISWMPLSVASRFFPLRTIYSRFSSTSIIEARVAGVPRPLSFMASDSSFSSSVLPAVSIAVSSVPSVSRLGATCLLLQALDIQDVLRLAARESRRQRLFFLLGRGFALRHAFCARFADRALSSRSAGLLYPTSDSGRSRAVHDRRDHRRHRPDVILMPCAQQPAADEVIDARSSGERLACSGGVTVGMMAW